MSCKLAVVDMTIVERVGMTRVCRRARNATFCLGDYSYAAFNSPVWCEDNCGKRHPLRHPPTCGGKAVSITVYDPDALVSICRNAARFSLTLFYTQLYTYREGVSRKQNTPRQTKQLPSSLAEATHATFAKFPPRLEPALPIIGPSVGSQTRHSHLPALPKPPAHPRPR